MPGKECNNRCDITIPTDRTTRKNYLLPAVAILAACSETGPPETPSENDAFTVRCGRLIDGLGDAPRVDQLVSIVDGRISAVTDGGLAGEVSLDLSDHTCLPGLIDTHTHIAEPPDTADLSIYYSRTLEETIVIGRDNAAGTPSLAAVYERTDNQKDSR